MIEIIYHDGTNAIPCPPGQTGGFENAEGNGEVHCYPLMDGVSAMLDATGYGESKPVAPNENADGSDNPAGRALNRRVEIFIPAF